MVVQSSVQQRKHNGFSLIELMVVMAIMAVLMSLSGGLMQKSINQQARQVELEQVTQLFKKISYRAYYGGGAIQVNLEKNQMQIMYVTEPDMEINKSNSSINDIPNSDNETQTHDIEIINFDQLVFVAQSFNVSAKGVVSPNQFQVFWFNEIKTIEFTSLYTELDL